MLYLILPAYNEEKSLPSLFAKLDILYQKLNGDMEVIVCDDGSEDQTATQLVNFQKKLPYLYVITHKINRGLGESIRDLIEYVVERSHPNDIVVRFDADDSHDPQFVLSMVEKINKGYDVVIASRFQPGGGQAGVSKFRATISLCANLFMKTFFSIKRYSRIFMWFPSVSSKYFTPCN